MKKKAKRRKLVKVAVFFRGRSDYEAIPISKKLFPHAEFIRSHRGPSGCLLDFLVASVRVKARINRIMSGADRRGG